MMIRSSPYFAWSRRALLRSSVVLMAWVSSTSSRSRPRSPRSRIARRTRVFSFSCSTQGVRGDEAPKDLALARFQSEEGHTPILCTVHDVRGDREGEGTLAGRWATSKNNQVSLLEAARLEIQRIKAR